MFSVLDLTKLKWIMVLLKMLWKSRLKGKLLRMLITSDSPCTSHTQSRKLGSCFHYKKKKSNTWLDILCLQRKKYNTFLLMHLGFLDKYISLQLLMVSRHIHSKPGWGLKANTSCLAIAAVNLSDNRENISFREAPVFLYWFFPQDTRDEKPVLIGVS